MRNPAPLPPLQPVDKTICISSGIAARKVTNDALIDISNFYSAQEQVEFFVIVGEWFDQSLTNAEGGSDGIPATVQLRPIDSTVHASARIAARTFVATASTEIATFTSRQEHLDFFTLLSTWRNQNRANVEGLAAGAEKTQAVG
jgi:hypothetical protein